MTPDTELMRIFDELLNRIQHIGIALQGQGIRPIKITGHYNLNKADTPSIEETEDAFMKWNCAILTAFRGSETLTPEANLERNIGRNNELKAKMIKQQLQFRSVNGCYREATETGAEVVTGFFLSRKSKKPMPIRSSTMVGSSASA